MITDIYSPDLDFFTHWGRVTHICVSKLTIIGWENGLSPDRHQAIISTNDGVFFFFFFAVKDRVLTPFLVIDGVLLIRTLGTNFTEILIEIHTFSFNKMHLKMSSGKWRPCCLGLSVLTWSRLKVIYHDGECSLEPELLNQWWQKSLMHSGGT